MAEARVATRMELDGHRVDKAEITARLLKIRKGVVVQKPATGKKQEMAATIFY